MKDNEARIYQPLAPLQDSVIGSLVNRTCDRRLSPAPPAEEISVPMKVSHSHRIAWRLTLAPKPKVLGALGSRYRER